MRRYGQPDARSELAMTPRGRATEVADLEGAIAALNLEYLPTIVGAAADRHDDVARAVSLAATRDTDDLGQS